MAKKVTRIGFVLLMILPFIFSIHPGLQSQAAANALLEVGAVRSIGGTAIVPVTLHNTTYLTSGQLSISLPSENDGVTLVSFVPSPLFDGKGFRTTGNINENTNTLTIDFISQTGKEQSLPGSSTVIGYITYQLSDQFYPGDTVPLHVTKVVAKGRYNSDLTLELLDGQIENRVPVGDVTGDNKVSVKGAMRVLQHIKGNFITNHEQFLSADVDADGVLTQNDAKEILDYATGKRTTFLAVAAQELNDGLLKSEYSQTIEARNGREPYHFKRISGSMPTGLTLDEQTGELHGIPTTAGKYTFVVQVTDAVGDTAERQFTAKIIDSNILSVEKIDPITVTLGGSPVLPSQVTVTYKNQTTGKENVKWDQVDTSVLGTVTAKGSIGTSGFTISVPINVIKEDYIKNITDKYVPVLNLYAIIIDTTTDVYAVTVNNKLTLYEGDNQFSLASTTFTAGSSVKLCVYDKYGNLLETKVHQLPDN